MSIEVFHRYEKKYILDEEQFQAIAGELEKHMRMDAYNEGREFYTICNIYYDTLYDDLIRRSLERPVYKEKLRIRSYGIPDLDTEVFLEIKKKYKGLVNKRRTTLPLCEAYRFVSEKTLDMERFRCNPQVIKELEYFLSVYQGLEPKVYIAYDRKAFLGSTEPDLRVTFDRNLRARREDVRLEAGDYGTLILPKEKWLMEIKSIQTMPLWLADLLNKYHINSLSFSKYGTEYMNELKEKGTGAIKC